MALKGRRQRHPVAKGPGWVFNPPPGWPVPPPGWQPPKHWEPDPSWPPAPAGWEFWKPDPLLQPPAPEPFQRSADQQPFPPPYQQPPFRDPAPPPFQEPAPRYQQPPFQEPAPPPFQQPPFQEPAPPFQQPPFQEPAPPPYQQPPFPPPPQEIRVTLDGQPYAFPPGQPVRIGRATDNDVVVSQPTVSRKHAQLTREPDGWVFENVGQAPTFLGEEPVTRVAVNQPVELRLGSPDGPVLRLEPPPPVRQPPAAGLR